LNNNKTIVVNRHLEAYDRYIGRGTPFGNPASSTGGDFTKEEAIHYYQWYFDMMVNTDKVFKEKLLALKGLKIACSCKRMKSDNPNFGINDKICHGDIIAKYLNEIID
jgi:hypothetical protein